MKATIKISIALIILLSATSSLNAFFTTIYNMPGDQNANQVIKAYNGYALVGSTTENTGGDKDALFIRTDYNGNIIFKESFGDSIFNDEAFAIVEQQSGPGFEEYIIATSSEWQSGEYRGRKLLIYDICILELPETTVVSIVLQRTFNWFFPYSLPHETPFLNIIPTTMCLDSNYNVLIGGWLASNYDTTCYINDDTVTYENSEILDPDSLKCEAFGFVLNCGSGGADSNWLFLKRNGTFQTRFYDLDVLSDGSIIVTGWSENEYNATGCWQRFGNLFKLNTTGSMLWQQNHYDNTYYKDIEYYSLVNSGFFFVITGAKGEGKNSALYDILFSKTYTNGTLASSMTYGYSGLDDVGYSITPGYLIAGFYKSSVVNSKKGFGYVLQLEASGDTSELWEYGNIGAKTQMRSIINVSIPAPPYQPGFVACGTYRLNTQPKPPLLNDIILTYQPVFPPQDNITGPDNNDCENSFKLLNVLTKDNDITINLNLPNDGHYTIDAYNVLGQKVCSVYNGYLSAGEASVRSNLINSSGELLSNGVYFIHVEADNGSVLNHKISILE